MKRGAGVSGGLLRGCASGPSQPGPDDYCCGADQNYTGIPAPQHAKRTAILDSQIVVFLSEFLQHCRLRGSWYFALDPVLNQHPGRHLEGELLSLPRDKKEPERGDCEQRQGASDTGERVEQPRALVRPGPQADCCQKSSRRPYKSRELNSPSPNAIQLIDLIVQGSLALLI